METVRLRKKARCHLSSSQAGGHRRVRLTVQSSQTFPDNSPQHSSRLRAFWQSRQSCCRSRQWPEEEHIRGLYLPCGWGYDAQAAGIRPAAGVVPRSCKCRMACNGTRTCPSLCINGMLRSTSPLLCERRRCAEIRIRTANAGAQRGQSSSVVGTACGLLSCAGVAPPS